MVFGKKYAWLQMVMWQGIDQWAWTINISHIIIAYIFGSVKYTTNVKSVIWFLWVVITVPLMLWFKHHIFCIQTGN